MDLTAAVQNMMAECTKWIQDIRLPEGGLPSEHEGSYGCTWTTVGLTWASWCAGVSFDEFYMRKALSWVLRNRNSDQGIPHICQGDYSITDATAQTAIACSLAFYDTKDEFYKDELGKCIRWLLFQQLGTTGWNWRPSSEPSWVVSTVFALHGLYYSGQLFGYSKDMSVAIDNAISWLRGIQNKDGGWGSYEGGKSRPAVTALVCSLMTIVDKQFDYTAAIDFILSQQRPDGSWFDTIDRPTYLTIERLGTSNCLKALADCSYPLDSREFQSAFEALKRSYEKGTFRYGDTDVVSWPTRDGLLALTSVGLRLGLDNCRGIMTMQHAQAPSDQETSTRPGKHKGGAVQPDMPGFKIELRPESDNCMSVYCCDTPLGEASHVTELPLTFDELTTILKAIEIREYDPELFTSNQTQLLVDLNILDKNERRLKPSLFQNVGQLLYSSIFKHDVEDAFRMAFNQARSLRKSLHLQCRFSETASSIARYPWELLHDGRRHLVSGGAVELTRYISYPESSTPLKLSSPLHILFVSSRPAELNELNSYLADDEWILVKKALQSYVDRREVILDRLEHATYDKLREKLEGTKYQVLHLDGHGVYARRCPVCDELHYPHHLTCTKCKASMETIQPSGFFAFEDINGHPDYASSTDLQNIIITSKICLAFMSACQTSLVHRGNIFGGIGPGLVQAGIPAVIAMQLSISCESAAKFAMSVYDGIMKGMSLSAAVGAGRKALFRHEEWYIPTLWLRQQ